MRKFNDYLLQLLNILCLGKISGVDDKLPEMNYYFVPVIIITLGAYFIADVFFGVYEMAVDTLFLCFLEVNVI